MIYCFWYPLPHLLYPKGVGLQVRSESITIRSRPRLYLYLPNLQDLPIKASWAAVLVKISNICLTLESSGQRLLWFLQMPIEYLAKVSAFISKEVRFIPHLKFQPVSHLFPTQCCTAIGILCVRILLINACLIILPYKP
jgi:hypothetical protein